MNDFTNPELRLMYALINELILETTQPPCVHELKEKIKSMSINYCDHRYSPTDALNVPLHCLDCGEKFE